MLKRRFPEVRIALHSNNNVLDSTDL
jgi:hypothetical protein